MKTKIKELRKSRKLSQTELADAVGTTRQTITSIEVGKYTASLVLAYKIAHYFDLTIEEVFDLMPFKYVKVTLGKGLTTMNEVEQILDDMSEYLSAFGEEATYIRDSK